MDIINLVRPCIANLEPYSSARDEYTGRDAIFLDANENPFNTPYNRYPDPYQADLKKQISKLKKVPAGNIFLGNGSDEAIDLLYRIFCEPGQDNVVSIDPTYGMYKVAAGINNVEVKKVSLKPDFSLDIQALKNACTRDTKMLFICSPNNPTSNSFDPDEILELAKELNLIVVVDEAYIDFSSRESLIQQIDNFQNLVVLQTFSKAWAMAGIRLGMAITNPDIIHFLNKVKYPYNLNMLTINHAMHVLKDSEKVRDWIDEILEQRKILERQLKIYRFVSEVYPSDANFLLVKVNKPKKIYNYLVEKNIVVRDRSNIQLIEGSLRITVGSSEENQKLTDALMEYQRVFVDSCEI